MGTICKLRKDTDRGNALVMVIGLGFAFVIIGITLAIATTFAASTASNSRAGVQAQGAADGGVDSAINYLNNVEIGKESGFVCSIGPTQTTTAHGTSEVMTSIKFLKEAAPEDTPYSCNPGVIFADGTDMQGAEITSTATLKTMTANGPKTTVRTVQQTLEFNDTEPVPPLFGYGVFSDGKMATTNNFTINGGGAFTNEDFECNSNSQIFGDVTAVGKAVLSNSCVIGKLTTGKNITCSSGAHIEGNVTSASLSQTNFSSGCKVDGNVWTGGDFDSQATTVAGNALSATGKITQQSSSSIGGWAQAGTTVTGGTVVGGRVEHVASDAPIAPPKEDMPPIHWSDITGPGAGNPPVLSFGQWVKENAENNGAQSWAPSRTGTYCKPDVANYDLNGGLEGPAVDTIIDARACGDVQMTNMTIHLEADLTIVVPNLESTNGFTVTTENGDPDNPYKLRIIVPLPAGAPSCSGAGEGEISFKAGGVNFAPEAALFLYTNGKVELTNGVTLTGSIYACETNLSNNTSITYEDGTPPGMGNAGGTHYNFQHVKRFDVR